MSDDDKEWKSSYDRFVEAFQKFIEKANRTNIGVQVELSRDELLSHLQDRAGHYAAEAQLLQEQKPSIEDLLYQVPTYVGAPNP